jgi:hypothetical protein
MSIEWKRENKILKMMLLAPAAVIKLKPDARSGIFFQVIVARGRARGRREYITLTAVLEIFFRRWAAVMMRGDNGMINKWPN